MYRARTLTDLDVLTAVREDARAAPKRFRAELGKVARGPIAQRIVRRLGTEPGKPHYPIRWKSPKQRRFVMAKLRRENNIPYQRTHDMARAWTVTLDSIQDGQGLFIVGNNSRYVEFVQGDYAQPFHLDTGWEQAAVVIADESKALQDAVINVWFKITEGK